MISVLESRAQRTGWWPWPKNLRKPMCYRSEDSISTRLLNPLCDTCWAAAHLCISYFYRAIGPAAGCIHQILRHSERGTACRLHHSQRRVATWLQEFTRYFMIFEAIAQFRVSARNSTSAELCHATPWGLQHSQISPRRFYMSKIKCGSKMMPGSSTCLIKWSVTHPAPLTSCMSAQGFSD